MADLDGRLTALDYALLALTFLLTVCGIAVVKHFVLQ